MAESQKEKRSRFARIFPPRIEKVVDQFRVIGNCANPSNYDFDRERVAKVWIHILEAMADAGDKYGLELNFTINGKTTGDLYEEGSVESLLKDPEPLF